MRKKDKSTDNYVFNIRYEPTFKDRSGYELDKPGLKVTVSDEKFQACFIIFDVKRHVKLLLDLRKKWNLK